MSKRHSTSSKLRSSATRSTTSLAEEKEEEKGAVVYARVVRGDAFVAWAQEHAKGVFDDLSQTSTEEFVNKLVRPLTANGIAHNTHKEDWRKSTSRDSKRISSSSSSSSKSKRKSRSNSCQQSAASLMAKMSMQGNGEPVRLFDILPAGMTKMVVLAASLADMKDHEMDYVFLSHTWKRPISELLQYVDLDRWFWIDIISVLQHKGEDQVADLHAIEPLVQCAKELWALIDDSFSLFTRTWCVYELCNRLRGVAPGINTRVHFEAVESVSRLGLAGIPEEEWSAEQAISFCASLRDTLQNVLKTNVDVRQTRAMLESDRKRILKWIDDEVGFEQANELISTNVEARIDELNRTLAFYGSS